MSDEYTKSAISYAEKVAKITIDLFSEDRVVRMKAADGLRNLGKTQAPPHLIELALSHKDSDVRWRVAEMATNLSQIIRGLEDEDHEVRAIHAGNESVPLSEEVIQKCFKDYHQEVLYALVTRKDWTPNDEHVAVLLTKPSTIKRALIDYHEDIKLTEKQFLAGLFDLDLTVKLSFLKNTSVKLPNDLRDTYLASNIYPLVKVTLERDDVILSKKEVASILKRGFVFLSSLGKKTSFLPDESQLKKIQKICGSSVPVEIKDREDEWLRNIEHEKTLKEKKKLLKVASPPNKNQIKKRKVL